MSYEDTEILNKTDAAETFRVELPEELEVLFGALISYSYEEEAFVLFRQDGKLYEVHGSHCSCYGFEGQWEPEETSLKALRFEVEQGCLTKYTEALTPILERLSDTP